MDHEKLPVFDTVKLALRWGVFVVRRHWLIILIFAALLVATSFVMMAAVEPGQVPGARFHLLSFGFAVLYGVLSIVLALVTHNEVLRGASGLNAQTLGWGAGRVLGYAVDSLVLPLFGLLVMFPLVLVVMLLTGLIRQIAPPMAPDALIVVLIIGAWLASVFVVARLVLRLPSRALGQPMPWRDVWRLGRGNTGRLVLAHLLLGVVLLFLLLPLLLLSLTLTWLLPDLFMQQSVSVQATAMAPVWGQWGVVASETALISPITSVWGILLSLLGNALLLAEIVIFCAFLSVAYAELKRIREARAPQTAGSRIYSDPNEPPEDF
ncbi:hypothetical protein [Xanthobacter autotrophicus]|uniref:hypothetical protein n=1 Tax=Xanthobacter autotrophicus TaxID=280 RepID=UPI0037273A3D